MADAVDSEKRSREPCKNEAGVVDLKSLSAREVPEKLRCDYYFDYSSFEHRDIFKGACNVIDTLDRLPIYIKSYLKSKVDLIEGKQSEKWRNYSGDGQVLQIGRAQMLVQSSSSATCTAVIYPERLIGVQDQSTVGRLLVASGAQILGGIFDLSQGDVEVGAESMIHPGTYIKGPCIVGQGVKIFHGAFIRENCLIGDRCLIRGELKHVLLLPNGEFCHPSYLGDSICGNRAHFGNQATAANYPLLAPERVNRGINKDFVSKKAVENDSNQFGIILQLPCGRYATRRRKIGIVLGDNSQLGCNAVSDPATFLAPDTHVYPLVRLSKGFYGPREIVKNKAIEKGVCERIPLR